MPRDPRPFITLHDGMPEHPKIEGLSDAAFRLLVTTWCWCNRNRTNGEVREVSWLKRGTPKVRSELIAAGLAEPTADGVLMHDYLEHQRSAAEIDELSRKRREAGSKGGKAKASARASAKQNLEQMLKQTPSKVLAEQEEELARDTSSKDVRVRALSSSDPFFAEFWDTYPRKAGKPEALKAFAKALKRAEPQRIIDGARRYRDDPNRDDAFTAHPATWLNRDSWDDPPLPARQPRAVNETPRRPPGWEFGMGN